MKFKILYLALVSISLLAHGDNESAISELNVELVPIYESLIADGDSTELIGKHLDLSLNLKHASHRHLLFLDTQIVVDEYTKYYLVKWKFDPGDVEVLLGKSDIQCRVTGRIIEVIKGTTSPGMPYVVAELLRVEI